MFVTKHLQMGLLLIDYGKIGTIVDYLTTDQSYKGFGFEIDDHDIYV